MATFLSVLKTIGVTILSSALSFAIKLMEYMISVHKDELKRQEEKKMNESNERLEKVCDDGTLSDLLDATKESYRQ